MSQNRGHNWRYRGRGRGGGGPPPMDRRYNRPINNNWNHRRNNRNAWINNGRDYMNDLGFEDHRNDPPAPPLMPPPSNGRPNTSQIDTDR